MNARGLGEELAFSSGFLLLCNAKLGAAKSVMGRHISSEHCGIYAHLPL